MYSKSLAIERMNQWGNQRTPFLFIIDFEMKAIRLYRMDDHLPDNIWYHFRGKGNLLPMPDGCPEYSFHKYPIAFEAYLKAFEFVHNEIKTGNSYLTNLTFPTPIETSLSLRDIFNHSKAPYKLLLEGEFVCFSPESFVQIRNGTISTYPMKGTIKANTLHASREILSNPKESAEHSTVVDLLRNDLSMVAYDVSVRRFRYIDRLRTNEGEILQVSSEITGLLPAGYNNRLGDLLFKLLPAGSVTGAPKIRTTAIIQESEKSERGYYTGICGLFDGRDLDSAVMIRFIEMHRGKTRFRSGGGITFLSNAQSEYHELIDKVYVPIV
jgi:para-aminobenzoate synthetase component 1